MLLNKIDKQIVNKNIGSTLLKMEVQICEAQDRKMEPPAPPKLCDSMSVSVISSQNMGEKSIGNKKSSSN